MKFRKCRNPLCPEEGFFPKRIDQVFCCTACRNQFNNQKYKKRKEPYKNLADGLEDQDEIIASIIKNNPQIYVKLEDFEELKIDLKKAVQLVYDKEGCLKQALFLKYEISHYNKNLFKIKLR